MSSEFDVCTCGAKFLPGDAFCGVCGKGRPVAPKPVRGAVADPIRNQLAASTKGRYEILAQLGRGGFGAVYLANDSVLGRRVAIKVLSSHLDVDSTVDRFYREARTQAGLAHPNVVAVFGVDDTSELPHFTMQYIPGRSLQQLLLDLLSEKKTLSLGAVQALVYQIGEALNFAHSRGVIHRDVKAGNILLDENGNAVVTDFGIAKVVDDVTGTWTELGVGTPAYMSPEQIKRSPITPASDQYSLGVLVHELLTGLPPFAGSSYELHHAHLNTAAPSVREKRSECPRRVAEAVRRMLAKRPEQRFPHLRDALVALGARPIGLGDDAIRRELIAAADVAGTDERLRAKANRKVEVSLSSNGVPAVGAEQLVSTLTLDRHAVDFAVGDECELRVVARTFDGSVVESLPVEWSSSNPRVLSVTSTSGVSVRARGVGVGSGTISATVSGASAACAVTVRMPAGEHEIATVVPSEVHVIEARAAQQTELEVGEIANEPKGVVDEKRDRVTTTARWRVRGEDGYAGAGAPNESFVTWLRLDGVRRRVLWTAGGSVVALVLIALAVPSLITRGARDNRVRAIVDVSRVGSRAKIIAPGSGSGDEDILGLPNQARRTTSTQLATARLVDQVKPARDSISGAMANSESRDPSRSIANSRDASGSRVRTAAASSNAPMSQTTYSRSGEPKPSLEDSILPIDLPRRALLAVRDSSTARAMESAKSPSAALLSGEAERVCEVLSSGDAVQLGRFVGAADAKSGSLTSEFLRWWQEYAPSAKLKEGSLVLTDGASEASFHVEFAWKNSGGRRMTRVAVFVANVVRSGDGYVLQFVRPAVRFW